MKINQIAVHQNPHLDELVAVWLLRNYGDEKFPGIAQAKIVSWGKKELANTPADLAVLSGILLVGIGGGSFDEHTNGRREECAATLVAKHLAVFDDPVLKPFLLDVLEADSKASGRLKFLAAEVKSFNRYWAGSMDLEKLYLQILPSIIVRLERQKHLQAAHERVTQGYQKCIGEVRLVAADQFDNVEFQHAARDRGAKVVIQRNTAGLMQILGSEGLDMSGLAIKIRRAERLASKIRTRYTLKDRYLAETGTIPEIPQWYFEKAMLLNGSESYNDVPRSAIKFEEVVTIVEDHLRGLLPKQDKPAEVQATPVPEVKEPAPEMVT